MTTNKSFYTKLLDSLTDGVYFVDPNRSITYWNKAAEMLTGFKSSEMVGKNCFADLMTHVDDRGTTLCSKECPLQKTLTDNVQSFAEVYLRHKDGHRVPVSIRVIPVLDAQDRVKGAIEIFNDMSERTELQARMAELEKAALLDPLTGLTNRRYATQTLANMLNQMRRYGWSFGLLFIDLDGFKAINDQWGHEIGDRVLRMVSRTLASNLRSFDVVARWGGDEFIAIIVNVNRESLYGVADKLRILVSESSLRAGKERIGVTISVGGVLPAPKDTVKSLVKKADTAMYRSKSAGGNRVSTPPR
jgi:diguanylate cyclase (GGDEF)-like protein/PAS domain S-box-containing protein